MLNAYPPKYLPEEKVRNNFWSKKESGIIQLLNCLSRACLNWQNQPASLIPPSVCAGESKQVQPASNHRNNFAKLLPLFPWQVWCSACWLIKNTSIPRKKHSCVWMHEGGWVNKKNKRHLFSTITLPVSIVLKVMSCERIQQIQRQDRRCMKNKVRIQILLMEFKPFHQIPPFFSKHKLHN